MTFTPIDDTPTRDAARSYIWRTREGEDVALGGITDIHLKRLEAYLERGIEAAKSANLDILEPKFQEGFTGQEDKIEYLSDTLAHVRVERQSRGEISSHE